MSRYVSSHECFCHVPIYHFLTTYWKSYQHFYDNRSTSSAMGWGNRVASLWRTLLFCHHLRLSCAFSVIITSRSVAKHSVFRPEFSVNIFLVLRIVTNDLVAHRVLITDVPRLSSAHVLVERPHCGWHWPSDDPPNHIETQNKTTAVPETILAKQKASAAHTVE